MGGWILLLLAASSDLWIWWKGSAQLTDLVGIQAPEILLVPGASVLRNGTPSPVLRQRLETAAEAARYWPRARLVLSGTAIAGGYDEPLAMRNFLLELGLDSSRMTIDPQGRNTRASLSNLGTPSGRLVVVSQHWHLPRAVWLAERRGWKVQGLVAGRGTPDGWENIVREHFVRIQNFWGSLTN